MCRVPGLLLLCGILWSGVQLKTTALLCCLECHLIWAVSTGRWGQVQRWGYFGENLLYVSPAAGGPAVTTCGSRRFPVCAASAACQCKDVFTASLVSCSSDCLERYVEIGLETVYVFRPCFISFLHLSQPACLSVAAAVLSWSGWCCRSWRWRWQGQQSVGFSPVQ